MATAQQFLCLHSAVHILFYVGGFPLVRTVLVGNIVSLRFTWLARSSLPLSVHGFYYWDFSHFLSLMTCTRFSFHSAIMALMRITPSLWIANQFRHCTTHHLQKRNSISHRVKKPNYLVKIRGFFRIMSFDIGFCLANFTSLLCCFRRKIPRGWLFSLVLLIISTQRGIGLYWELTIVIYSGFNIKSIVHQTHLRWGF